MRAWIVAGLVSLLSSVAAVADERLVVVELYTSQGCSACPPADALLLELRERDDVVPLALHVDYWDYIGWKDKFAQPAFTERQKAYAYAAGHRTIYTPQIIVGGRDHMVGSKPMKLAELIEAHGDMPAVIDLRIVRRGDKVAIIAQPLAELQVRMTVQLVRYRAEETVQIGRGENAGRTLTYGNIVTEWRPLAQWDGTGRFEIEADAPGQMPVVALVQEVGPGDILAAAALR